MVEQVLYIIKELLKSNAINFLIMLWILYAIISKFNLGEKLQLAIDNISSTITKSEEVKAKAKEELEKANAIFDKLPQDIEELNKNTDEKINIYENSISENTKSVIRNIKNNIDRIIQVEEDKTSNILKDKTSEASIEVAKTYLETVLEENPELHNKFIETSLEELERVKL